MSHAMTPSFERYRQGIATAEEARQVVRALLLDEIDISVPDETPFDDSAYADAFARATTNARATEEQVAEEDSQARKAVDALTDVATDALPDAHLGRSDLRSWSACAHLQARSFETALDDPSRAVALAKLAVEIADAMPEDRTSDRLRADLCAAAWTQLGNANRVATDMPATASALARADALTADGTGDPALRARLLGVRASSASDHSDFSTALVLVRRAVRAARRAGDRHDTARLILLEANILFYLGRADEAQRRRLAAIDDLDAEREPRLALVAQHNLISYLDQEGRHDEAWERLPAARRLVDRRRHPLDAVRLRWLEGRIASNRHDPAQAEASLNAVREHFLSRQVGYDAALVSLELAVLLHTQGRVDELRPLAEALVPAFVAHDVQREAQAALRLFVDAVRSETASEQLLRDLASQLAAAQPKRTSSPEQDS